MQWRLLSSNVVTDLELFRQVLLKNRGITDAKHFFEPLNPLEYTLAEVEIDSQQLKKALEVIQAHKQKSILISTICIDQFQIYTLQTASLFIQYITILEFTLYILQPILHQLYIIHSTTMSTSILYSTFYISAGF